MNAMAILSPTARGRTQSAPVRNSLQQRTEASGTLPTSTVDYPGRFCDHIARARAGSLSLSGSTLARPPREHDVDQVRNHGTGRSAA